MLRTRLYEEQVRKQEEEISSPRRACLAQVTEVRKSGHINFPQGRVTDHRIRLTVYNLPDITNGNISEFMTPCQFARKC